MRYPVLLAAVAAALGALPASAQNLARSVPEVASPGDLVLLRGSGLGATTAVRFTAFVGGFAGVLSFDVKPISVSSGEVAALVPKVNAFVGPNAVPPSSPFGQVSVIIPLGIGPPPAPLDFFFCEGTGGALETLGKGASQSSGRRAVISFDLKNGPPSIPDPSVDPATPKFIGNKSFTPLLENAPPSSVAALVVGLPAAQPFPLVGDGTLVIDLSGPLLVLLAPTDVMGDAQLALPVPVAAKATVALQWAAFDPLLPMLALSNGLKAVL